MFRRLFFAMLVVPALAASLGAILAAQPAARPAPGALQALKFRYIGPVGNRLTAIAGVPGNPRSTA